MVRRVEPQGGTASNVDPVLAIANKAYVNPLTSEFQTV